MIRLSRFADYGVALMTHMARQPAARHAAPELSASTGVPPAMTAKILKHLVRDGLVRSERGAKGGYALAVPAETISVARLVTVLDGPIALTACVDEGPGGCDLSRVCVARANWQRINDAIHDALDAITLDEMAFGIPEAFLRGPERPAATDTRST